MRRGMSSFRALLRGGRCHPGNSTEADRERYAMRNETILEFLRILKISAFSRASS
jgi:hypothetical protein